MRERISDVEYSELTDAFNSLFDGHPIAEPTLPDRKNMLSVLIGRDLQSSRGKTIAWTEQNTPGTVPSEFTAYKRSEGVSEKRHKMLNLFGKVVLNSHTFGINSGPAMGADYQIQSAFSQALVVDLESMRAKQIEGSSLIQTDPIAAFCESALTHIADIKKRS